MIMDVACQVDSSFDVRSDGVMVVACDVQLTIGYRCSVDGSTGTISYQPYVGRHVSPFTFTSIEQAQDDALRMMANVVGLKGLAIPEAEAIADMEYHVSVICSLAGVEQEECTVIAPSEPEGGESPFDVERMVDEGIAFEIVSCTVEALATDYRNFRLQKYLERIEPYAMHLDEYDYERFSCLCQLKGDAFIELEENVAQELRLHNKDEGIAAHLRMVLNGGFAALPSFCLFAKRTLGMIMNVHYWGTTDTAREE